LTVVKFDDLDTSTGWGVLPEAYNGLVFDGFIPFKPRHPRFEGLISGYDLNCAVSKPNALHGSRYNVGLSVLARDRDEEPSTFPSIQPSEGGTSFDLKAFRVKPLNFPINSVTLYVRGTRAMQSGSLLEESEAHPNMTWSVDFPAGYHEVLNVSMHDFTRHDWHNLSRIELWADFNNANSLMDWEFCIDDLEIEVHSI
jgi:hypothetical protein